MKKAEEKIKINERFEMISAATNAVWSGIWSPAKVGTTKLLLLIFRFWDLPSGKTIVLYGGLGCTLMIGIE
jgi:hypothetical protein